MHFHDLMLSASILLAIHSPQRDFSEINLNTKIANRFLSYVTKQVYKNQVMKFFTATALNVTVVSLSAQLYNKNVFFQFSHNIGT